MLKNNKTGTEHTRQRYYLPVKASIKFLSKFLSKINCELINITRFNWLYYSYRKM